MSVARDQILDWLRRSAEVLAENKDYLTQLDADIGDADHGINMDRGFKKVAGSLPSLSSKDIGEVLKGTGMALISSVGGASGPLYGTFFLRAANVAAGKSELNTLEVSAILRAGLAGVIERGKAQAGDKTLVDVLTPAAEAVEQAANNGKDLKSALEAGVKAAEEGMRSTIQMKAREGRASYLGDRSMGHQDPGATSAYLVLKALLEAVAGKG